MAAPAADTVDVYWADLDARSFGRRLGVLSDAEATRASEFRFARDRRRYVTARARLRELLAERLDCDPAEVPLATDAYGKPYVVGSDLRFSLSRSHGFALYALAEGRAVGCDIELRDATLASEAMAEQVFAPAEMAVLRSVAGTRRTEAFFNGWTRKEAYVKARGLGVALPFTSFEVSLEPDAPAALLSGCDGWSVRAFEPSAGYQAAVVGEGSGWGLRLHGGTARSRLRFSSVV